MAASGVAINPEVINIYGQIKNSKTDRPAYAFFKLNEKQTEIEVEKVKTCAERVELDVIMNELQDDAPRYVIYDFPYTDKNALAVSRIFFINWCPDTAKVKVKMIHSASKDALQRALGKGFIAVQVNDRGDLTKEELISKIPGML